MSDPMTIRRIRDRWLECDLDPTIAELCAEAAERVEALVADARSIDTEGKAERDAIVTDLASGACTLTEAVERDLALANRGAAKTSADELVRAAKGRAAGIATRRLRRMGDQLITDHLAPAHDDTLATIVEKAPLVVDITTDTEAARAPQEQRDAWAAILEAVTRRNRLIRLTEELRDDGILPSSRKALADDYLYRHPERLPSHLPRRGTPAGPPHHRVLEAIRAGAEPMLLTASQVDEHHGPPTPTRPPRVKVERDGTVIIDGVRPTFVDDREPSTIAPNPHDPQPWSAA